MPRKARVASKNKLHLKLNKVAKDESKSKLRMSHVHQLQGRWTEVRGAGEDLGEVVHSLVGSFPQPPIYQVPRKWEDQAYALPPQPLLNVAIEKI